MARRQNTKIQNKLPYKLYYFVCEDEKSMPYYLKGLKQKYDGKIVINYKTSHGKNALSVQKEAKKLQTEIKNTGAYANGYKIVACFDKDNNKIEDISEIISKNEKSEVMATIYNNPCYEYWLLLHIKPTAQGFTSSEQCCRETMKEINTHYNQNFVDLDKFKSAENIFNIVGDDLPKAIQNAKSLKLKDYNSTYTNAHVIFEKLIDEANI